MRWKNWFVKRLSISYSAALKKPANLVTRVKVDKQMKLKAGFPGQEYIYDLL